MAHGLIGNNSALRVHFYEGDRGKLCVGVDRFNEQCVDILIDQLGQVGGVRSGNWMQSCNIVGGVLTNCISGLNLRELIICNWLILK